MRTPMLFLAAAALLVACGDNLTEPTADPTEGLLPFASEVANSGTPALVFNFGEGKDNPNCTFGTFGTSNNGTFVRAPNGQGIATCRLWGFRIAPILRSRVRPNGPAERPKMLLIRSRSSYRDAWSTVKTDCDILTRP